MKNIKNVIIISDYTYVEGGAAKVAIDTANRMARHFECYFLSPSYEEKSQLNANVHLITSEQGDFLNYSNKIIGMLNGLKNKKFFKLVRNTLKKFSNEDTIIHVHGWTKACSAYFFRAISKGKFKCFLTAHDYFLCCSNGGFFNYKTKKSCCLIPGSLKCLFCNCDSRNYYYKIYRNLRLFFYKKYINSNIRLICVSDFQKDKMVKYLKFTNVYTLENPIDMFEISEIKKKYDYTYIGRITDEKGYFLFENLCRDFPSLKFCLVGKTTTSLNNLHITGWVSDYEVLKQLSMSKCLILPSMWPETYGLNIKRALILGIDCIVSSNTYAATIDDNKVFVFEQGNYESLKKIVELHYNSNLNYEKRNFKDDYDEKLIKIYKS